jgi:hypothetical protein
MNDILFFLNVQLDPNDQPTFNIQHGIVGSILTPMADPSGAGNSDIPNLSPVVISVAIVIHRYSSSTLGSATSATKTGSARRRRIIKSNIATTPESSSLHRE